MSVKYFQIMSDGKTVKELTEEEYLRRLNRQNYDLGWIDNANIYFTRPTLLTKSILIQIEKLGGWAI